MLEPIAWVKVGKFLPQTIISLVVTLHWVVGGQRMGNMDYSFVEVHGGDMMLRVLQQNSSCMKAYVYS
jgi:hypothetical protein